MALRPTTTLILPRTTSPPLAENSSMARTSGRRRKSNSRRPPKIRFRAILLSETHALPEPSPARKSSKPQHRCRCVDATSSPEVHRAEQHTHGRGCATLQQRQNASMPGVWTTLDRATGAPTTEVFLAAGLRTPPRASTEGDARLTQSGARVKPTLAPRLWTQNPRPTRLTAKCSTQRPPPKPAKSPTGRRFRHAMLTRSRKKRSSNRSLANQQRGDGRPTLPHQRTRSYATKPTQARNAMATIVS